MTNTQNTHSIRINTENTIMSFADLKKQSRMGSMTQKLMKHIEKLNSSESGADNRFWKPEVDKAGNGFAVIRFMPAPEGCELPFVQVWSHAFQGPGGWYIENSLTTLGQKDPVGEYNRVLWNTGNKADQEIARKQKRKLSYYANIYVVSDPAHPENEGKVFLYKFGKKIYDKIAEAMNPQFADEQAFDPFDFWTGANFKLKIRKVDGYWNYDKSEFESPSVFQVERGLSESENELALEQTYGKLNDLNEFVDPKNFKSYDELKKRFDSVMGKGAKPVDPEVEDEEDDSSWGEPVSANIPVRSQPVSSSYNEDTYSVPSRPVATKYDDEDDEDDALSYFQRLAES